MSMKSISQSQCGDFDFLPYQTDADNRTKQWHFAFLSYAYRLDAVLMTFIA